MTTTAPDTRFIHAAAFYASDDEFVAGSARFCEAGLAAGDPTVVRVDPRKAEMLRSALSDPAAVTFLTQCDQYGHPPGALAAALQIVDRHRPRRAHQRVRILGELPVRTGLSREAWLRYEAAANHALRGMPVFGLCAYDVGSADASMREEISRTHTFVVDREGRHKPNAGFRTPEVFMRGRVARDPMEERPADVELTDPAPAVARQRIGGLCHAMALNAPATDALLIATSEIVSNAIRHGRRPITVRGWGVPGRVVVAVNDVGAGPSDPFVGLLPVEPAERVGGYGLWIVQQLCPEIAMSTAEGGFTVRLAAGQPHATLEADR